MSEGVAFGGMGAVKQGETIIEDRPRLNFGIIRGLSLIILFEETGVIGPCEAEKIGIGGSHRRGKSFFS
jgi:hypothetical protein